MENRNVEEVKEEDLTFVVCGKIIIDGNYSTIKSLNSIKKYFPTSTIVLSTWENEENLQYLDKKLYDVLILNPYIQPKYRYYLSGKYEKDNRLNSINQQIKLVTSGLNVVKTKFAVRFRTDFLLKSNKIIKMYNVCSEIMKKYDEIYKIFQERVLVYDYYTQNPRAHLGGFSYAVSDCLQLGLTDDLKKCWNGDYISDDNLNYFEIHKKTKKENPYLFNHRYINEQNFFLGIVRRSLKLELPNYYWDNSKDNFIIDFEKIVASNLIVLGGEIIGVSSKFEGISKQKLLTSSKAMELYINYNDDSKKCRAIQIYFKEIEKFLPFKKKLKTFFRKIVRISVFY